MSYTYLIGWSKLNKFYYGRRTAKSCDPAEFWVSYFTSSKHVKNFRILHGDPDVKQIRKVFSNHKKCINWECTVLRRLKVNKSDKWLNMVAGDLNWDTTGWALPHSEETKSKISNAHLNNSLIKSGYSSFEALFVEIQKLIDVYTNTTKIKKLLNISRNLIYTNFPIVKTQEYITKSAIVSEETRKKLSDALTGKIKSEETRKKLSDALTGKIKSKEHIEKIKKIKKIRQAAGEYDYIRTEEIKQNMRKPKSNTENYKKPKSEEHKKNMRINNTMNIRCTCLECKKIISANLLNYHYKRSHKKITE